MTKWRIIVPVVSTALALVLATQYTAAAVDYSPLLEGEIFAIGAVKVYEPWAYLRWMFADRPQFKQAVDVGFAILVLTMGAGIGVSAFLIPKTPPAKPFGQGRWGTAKHLREAGLFAEVGVVCGVADNGEILCYDGPEHQIVAGASRSGKGVGHVVPTLLAWPHSAIVYDIKGELWDITAGHRASTNHCIYFNPTRRDSIKFNPLFEVRKGDCEIRDAQNIAEMLVNPDGSKKTLDVWDNNTLQFLTGLILHVLYTEPDESKNLGRVRELLMEFDETCEAMQTTRHRLNPKTGEPEVHTECARVARSLLEQADRFRTSVRGTAEGYLTLYADPIVCENVSRSDFMIGDLVCGQRPVTLYIQPPPSDADRVRPLIRLLLNQVARSLMENIDADNRGRAKMHKLLFLIDEFPTLGRLQFFAENMRQMAGYGLKAMPIVQSFQDIIDAYGPHQTIIDNCHVLVAFATADTETQRRISQMCGRVTEYRSSYSGPRSIFSPGRYSKSVSEQTRPLLEEGEVRDFPKDQQLVFVTGSPPFKTYKLRYYEHPLFKSRLKEPPANAIEGCAIRPDWLGERPKGPPTVTESHEPEWHGDPEEFNRPLGSGGGREVGIEEPAPLLEHEELDIDDGF